MIALERVRQHLETLSLAQAAAVWDSSSEEETKTQPPYADPRGSVGSEVTARGERYLRARTRLAHPKTLSDFDFGFQPSLQSPAWHLLNIGPDTVFQCTRARTQPSPSGSVRRPRVRRVVPPRRRV